MAKRRQWSRDELLAVFRLYCCTPFGRLHQHNPDIIELATIIDRSPSAVAMKACNFASLDPVQQQRDITGLANVSQSDRKLWDEFLQDAEQIADEAEKANLLLRGKPIDIPSHEIGIPTGPTDVNRVVKSRRVQRFFRSSVLASYNYTCAISGISLIELINASHIIPWAANHKRRADPRNGIALNALYDRAFDRGFITLDENLNIMISPRLHVEDPPLLHRQALLDIDGRKIRSPDRFAPDSEALDYHRKHVFVILPKNWARG